MLRKIMIRNINTAVKKTLPFIGYLTMPGFRRDHESGFLQVCICPAKS